MKLNEQDLINYCKRAEGKTNGQFTITATKEKEARGLSISLELKNNRTNTTHHLAMLDGTRQACDYLKAFYKGLEMSELLAS